MTNESKITTKWWQDKSPVARMYLCDQYFHHRDWESLNQSQIMHMWTQESKKEGLYAGFPHIQNIVESILGPDPAEFLKFEAWLSGLSEDEARKLRELYYPGENLVEAVDWMKIYDTERNYMGIAGSITQTPDFPVGTTQYEKSSEVAKQISLLDIASTISDAIDFIDAGNTREAKTLLADLGYKILDTAPQDTYAAKKQAAQDKAEIEQLKERIRIKDKSLYLFTILNEAHFKDIAGLILEAREALKA